MTTLVTGGTGFVGLNIVEALAARGRRVVVMSNAELPDSARRAFPDVQTMQVDVADADAVQRAFAELRPEHVVHAAVITAGEARELAEFGRVVDVNLKGTSNVLAAAADHAVRRVIYVSSGSAYGGALVERDEISEETPASPDTLYAITKFSSERVCARLHALRGLDVVCTRLGSVFGPWERETGVRDTLSLPFQILRQARSGQRIVLSPREPRRDWIYSRDVAEGVIALLDASKLSHDLYNLSAGRSWPDFSMRSCEALRAIYPQLECRVAAEGEQPTVSFLGHRDRAMMSAQRLRDDVGFTAAYDTNAAFDDYIAWLRQQPSSQDA